MDYMPCDFRADADTKSTWTAHHKYKILYQDLLIAATKCHCCHNILRDSESRHHSTVPADQNLYVGMKLEFNEDNIGVLGALDVRVKFNDVDSLAGVEIHEFNSFAEAQAYCDSLLADVADVTWDDFNALADAESHDDNSSADDESRDDNLFADVGFLVGRHSNTDLLEGRQGEHPQFGHSHMVPVTGHSPANNTGSGYTAGFVKKCLEHCKTHHRSCQPESLGAPWYPTRLVEVLEGNTFRVIETAETVPAGPYATLSHCWGASRMITTTTENIGQLKKQLPLLDLPKTFSDALQFIKAIGISFIWIDSLCIIQDSVKDWEAESRTMLEVYRHAECNLAAAGSEDSRGGLFSERNHAILPSGWFEIDNNRPEVKGVYCAVPYDYFENAFDKQIGSSRLISRGWVFQERAASRRVIAFGRDQVFWDCSEVLESDVLPDHHIRLYHYEDENTPGGSKDNAMGMAVPKVLSPGVPRSFYSLGDGLVAWQFIVQRYSACAFTFNKDKPVAILGVAQMMSDALKAQPTAVSTAYWAGLWLQDMYRQLAWKASHPGLQKNCHAPSWSWLSVEGPVEWISVVDFDPKFYFFKASALITVAWGGNQKANGNSSFCNLSSDLKIWCNLYPLHVTEPLEDASSAAEEPCTPEVYLDYEDIGTDRLHFLPLIYNERESIDGDGDGDSGFINGMLVQPVDNRPGVYRRCGSARLRLSLHKRSPMKRFFNALRPSQHTIAKRVHRLLGKTISPIDFTFEKHNSKMGYLIRII